MAGAARFHDDVLQSDAVSPGAALALRRDPANEHDPNAIAVLTAGGAQAGWVPREVAAEIAPGAGRRRALGGGGAARAARLAARPAQRADDAAGAGRARSRCASAGSGGGENPPRRARPDMMGRAMARDTGFPSQDAQDDFLRVRRRRVFAQLSALLRLEPGDVDVMLSFDEVVDALGRVGERDLGVRSIPIETIVGTVDRRKEFDREFRPTSSRARARFERIAEAARRGVSMPPIDVYRIGELHFVRDGHHRVAVARAQGRDTIDAHVVEVDHAGGRSTARSSSPTCR